jgi:hypothetical protein
VGRQIEPVRAARSLGAGDGGAARVDSYEGLPGSFAEEVRTSGIRATVAAPILVDGQSVGRVRGGLQLRPFGPDAEARLGAFAELVAQAIANVDARIKLRESRARIVAAADDAAGGSSAICTTAPSSVLSPLRCRCSSWRGRLSRPPQRRSGLHRGPAHGARGAARAGARAASGGAHRARRAGGPPGACRALAGAGRARRGARPAPACRSRGGAVLRRREALTNAAKYANASAVEVTLHGDDRWAEIAVADDGAGGARAEGGSGLRGLADRIEALGGRFAVASAPGQGTTVRARVPVAAANADVLSAPA